MSQVGIVTDSTACIPADLAARHGVAVIPLFLEFGDQVYEDGVTADAAEFYQALHTEKRMPTTAAPAPGVYADAMLRIGERADAVVCFTVSREFSAMYDAAVQGAALAAKRAPDLDIRVVDSGAAAMAQGFVVLEAARAAQQGAAIDQVIQRAQALMPAVQLLVGLDTLTYLSHSGRVPRLLIWAASPLQVKPIVEFKRGAYRPVAFARTPRGMADRLLQALARRAALDALHVCVHHTSAPERAAELADEVRSRLLPKELLITEFTQVMGVHTGPGLLGFAFYTE